MKNRSIIFAVAFLVFLPAAAISADDVKVNVKRAWPPGQYIMTQTDTSQNQQTVGNQASKSKSNTSSVWQLTVGDPNDKGEKKILAKVLKYQFAEEGDSTSAYDSERPAEKQDLNNLFVYSALIGAHIEILLDADDAVVEVSGLDKLWADLSAKAKTDEQRSRLAQMSLELADKSLEQSLRRLESIVTKKEVAPGDKWAAGIRSDLPLVGEVKQRYDCSLKGVEDGPAGKLAVIHMEAAYESTKPKPGKIQGVEVTVSKLNVTEKADVKFDLSTGIPASDVKTLTISALIEANDEKGRQITINTSGTSEVKTTIVPGGEADIRKAGTPAPPASGEAGAPKEPDKGGGPAPGAPREEAAKPQQGAGVPAEKPSSRSIAPVVYVVYRYIDTGGIRDEATGEWLEAFRLLIPKDWKFQGGLRWIAREKPPNQISKTDALNPVKSDFAISSPDGRRVFRAYPIEYWVDTSRSVGNRMGAGFRAGANYNGMIVSPVVTPEQYIAQFVYPRQRGQVANLKVVRKETLPKLAELYSEEVARFDQAMAGARTQGNLSFKAGAIEIEYTDGETPYRETFVTVIQYIDTAGLVMFWPRVNISFRSPRSEFEDMKPVFATIATSVENNPRWSLYLIKMRERISMSQRQMDDYCNRIRREIAESHSATNRELARSGVYLSSPYHPYKGTDGKRYYLPTDQYHFMNDRGELLSQKSWDPPSSEWKSIEPYNE
jgi:hypothetical protein